MKGINILSIIIGLLLLYYSIQFYFQNATCLKYNVYTEYCNHSMIMSSAFMLSSVFLNMLNFNRLLKQSEQSGGDGNGI